MISNTTKRDVRLDALKGALIILVVVGHWMLADFFRSFPESQHFALLDAAHDTEKIYYFHMPLFLAVGVLFVRPFSFTVLRDNAVGLLVPYFFFATAIALVYSPVNDVKRAYGMLPSIVMGNHYWLKSLLWYLPALFSCRILVSLWLRIPSRAQPLALALGGVAWLIVLSFTQPIQQLHVEGVIPFGIDIAVYLLPLLMLFRYGYVNNWFDRVPWWLSLFAGATSFIVITVFEPIKMFNYRIDLSEYNMPYTLVGAFGFFVLATSIFALFLKIGTLRPLRVLAWVGVYSFPIYLLHVHFMYETYVEMMQSGPVASAWHSTAWACVALIVGIALPIVVSKILMRLSRDFRYLGFVP